MPSHGQAFKFLEDHAQEMFGEIKSMLYVGHRSDTHPWWRTTFRDKLGSPTLAVIDIVKANLDSANGLASILVHGDIRTSGTSGWGLVFWDEGPEHVSKEDALSTIQDLIGRNEHVLISCPWGHQPQGTGPSDPEFHHWAPQPTDFTQIGMMAEVFGTMFDGAGQGHGNLIAWT